LIDDPAHCIPGAFRCLPTWCLRSETVGTRRDPRGPGGTGRFGIMKYKNMLLAVLALFVVVTLSGCSSLVEMAVRLGSSDVQDDAEEYARQLGVSVEEAIRRLELQGEIGELNQALEEGEAETFAGLWIQHEPVYRVVVAFTRDAERTIQPYLKDKPWAGLVEVRRFPFSYKDLLAAQEQVVRAAQELGIPTTSYVSVTENRVIAEVGNPDLFLEELGAAAYQIPDPVEVVAFDPEHIPGSLRGGVDIYHASDGTEIYFPRQAPTNAYMQALMFGTLTLDNNGCLRVIGPDGSSDLILWHHDFTLRIEGDVIEILNGEGKVVARVGEPVQMGGGQTPSSGIPDLPLEVCPGPYWVLGDIEPLD
jgi:hypothetical protein